MVTDQEIIDYILTKWGEEEEMRALNEQYRYTPPYPTLHLEDFLPEECLQNLYHHIDDFDISGVETISTSVKFSSDGKTMFIIGVNSDLHWLIKFFIRILVLTPIYQVLLLFFGYIFFQYKFFYNFVKKFLSFLGCGFLFRN